MGLSLEGIGMRKVLFAILPLLGVGCASFQTSPIPPIMYQVGKGETLSQIAAHFSISEDALSELNEVSNGNGLRVGTMLQLPEVPEEQTSLSALHPIST